MAHVFGRIVILVYGEDARMVRILVVQLLEVYRIQSQNSTADCFGVSKVSCIAFTSERGMHIGGGLDIVSGFEPKFDTWASDRN